jgi:hypothetical protein
VKKQVKTNRFRAALKSKSKKQSLRRSKGERKYTS